LGRISACSKAIAIPTVPSTDPTDRSMLRDTMMSTMPVAMMATVAVCTERFQRLRGVRNVPPDQKWKPIQMMARAPSMPSKRVSISADRSSAPTRGRRGGAFEESGGMGGLAVTLMAPPGR
jgi:hypothetical protein